MGQGGLGTVVGGQGEGMDQERRIRREIANSNERRRMQSINAGFQSLRTLLPHHEGEKLSKVSGRDGFLTSFFPQGHVNFSSGVKTEWYNQFCFLGGHPATDSRIHLHIGAREDIAVVTEFAAEAFAQPEPAAVGGGRRLRHLASDEEEAVRDRRCRQLRRQRRRVDHGQRDDRHQQRCRCRDGDRHRHQPATDAGAAAEVEAGGTRQEPRETSTTLIMKHHPKKIWDIL